jgi:hypothetical protein
MSASQPVGGVNIMVEGAKSATATTDVKGYYTLSDLPEGGSYTVTPRAEMKFSPPSHSFENLRRNQSADFSVQIDVYKISGRVSYGNQNLRDVKISLEGSKLTSTMTDANGYYSFSELRADGTYTVTPRGNMRFNPPRRPFDKLRHDEAADFIVQTEVYKISGRVLSLAGPRGGVSVSIEGSRLTSTTTDNNGYYSFGELRAGGDYTVTPRGQSKFAPPRGSFNDLQRDVSVDFVQIDATPSPSPSPTCTEEDQGGALNTVQSFEPSWRRKIEGERAKIIGESVPDAAVEQEASLGRIEFQYRFIEPCRAADVLATYEWVVSYYSPVGGPHRINKTVPRRRRFACGKFLGAWVCH